MSADRPASSGFQNIRAMFENTDSSSSPNRAHRQSTGALSNGSTCSPSRSAVRSSFVAVEPAKRQSSPQEGLTNSMEESTAHLRRDSFSIDQASNPEVLADLKKTIGQEIEQRRRSSLMETVPEVAVVTPAIGREDIQLGEGAMGQQEANEATKKQKEVEKSPLRPSPIEDSSTQPPSILPTSPLASGHGIDANSPTTPHHEGAHDEAVEKTTTQQEGNATKSTPEPSLSQKSTSPAEKKSTATSRATSGTRDAKTGATTSTRAGLGSKKDNGNLKQDAKTMPGSAHRAGATRPSATRASSASMTGTSKDSPGRNAGLTRTRSHIQRGTQPPKPSSGPAPSQAKNGAKVSTQGATSLAPGKASNGPNATAPNKATDGKNGTSVGAESAPKARGSAFAPTASSAARTTTAGSSLQRGPSGAGNREKTLQRQPSTRNGAKPTTSGGTASSAKRQVGRQQPATERSEPSKDARASKPPTKPANDGFLARMMRPTASSAQKTHDKPGTVASKAASARNRPSVGRARTGPANGNPSAPAAKKALSDAGGSHEPEPEDHSQKGSNSVTDEAVGDASFSKSNDSAVDGPAASLAPGSTTENEQEASVEQPTEEVVAEVSTPA